MRACVRTYHPSCDMAKGRPSTRASADHGRDVVERRVVPLGGAGRSDREPVVDARVFHLVLLRPLSGRLRVLLHSGRAVPPARSSTMIAVLDSARVQSLRSARLNLFDGQDS